MPSGKDVEPSGVSLREAARRLGIGSVQTIQRWLKLGKLKGEKRVKPNGQEQWLVDLPDDAAELAALRQQLRRPSAPANAMFPGPPQDSVGSEREWNVIGFLLADLEAKRHQIQSMDVREDSISARLRSLESQIETLIRCQECHAHQVRQVLDLLQAMRKWTDFLSSGISLDT